MWRAGNFFLPRHPLPQRRSRSQRDKSLAWHPGSLLLSSKLHVNSSKPKFQRPVLVDVVHRVYISLQVHQYSELRKSGRLCMLCLLRLPRRIQTDKTTTCSNFVTKDCKSPAGIRGSILVAVLKVPKHRHRIKHMGQQRGKSPCFFVSSTRTLEAS